MKKKILIAALISVAVIAVVVTVCLIVFREQPEDKTVLTPDYAPPATEDNAEKLEDEEDNKTDLDIPEGGGGVSISYWKEITIDLSDGQAQLRLDNPSRSHNNMVVQIVVQDNIVAQSGTLKPGYRISILDLLEEAPDMLTPGVYETNTKLVLLFYDPDTGEKELVDAEIPVTVTVKE